MAVGKGATVQEFTAIVGADKLAIDVAPWGEGHLRVNGQEIAHLNEAKDRRQAFRELKKIADHYLETKGRSVREGRKLCEITSRQSQTSRGQLRLL